MKHKKYIKLLFVSFAFFVSILAIFNYAIDPFQFFRKPFLFKPIFAKEMYLNAGLIKNYDFDSIIVGSSMTENFKLDEAKEYLGFEKPIKLTMSGGNMIEYSVLLTMLLIKKYKNVLFGLDIFSLDQKESRLSIYLYDDINLNDLKYVFNFDILKRSIAYLIASKLYNSAGSLFDFNLMYQWQHLNTDNDFNECKILEQFKNETSSINLGDSINQENLYMQRVDHFNKLLLKIIKENQDINFYIFYPPYSILTYKAMNGKNLIYFFRTKEYINNILSNFNNVKIYDFQDRLDIVTNLNNYKDLTHYHQKINTLMLQEISKSEGFYKKSYD